MTSSGTCWCGSSTGYQAWWQPRNQTWDIVRRKVLGAQDPGHNREQDGSTEEAEVRQGRHTESVRALHRGVRWEVSGRSAGLRGQTGWQSTAATPAKCVEWAQYLPGGERHTCEFTGVHDDQVTFRSAPSTRRTEGVCTSTTTKARAAPTWGLTLQHMNQTASPSR